MNQGTPSHINLQRVTSTPQPLKWGDRSQSSFALASNSMTPTAANNTSSALDRSSLRPLTQAFKGAQADYEVLFTFISLPGYIIINKERERKLRICLESTFCLYFYFN